MNGKIVLYRSWKTAGICTISNLVVGRRFKTCQELIAEFGNCVNVIDLTNIINAIPTKWRKVIRDDDYDTHVPTGIELVQDNLKCTSLVYNALIKIDHESFQAKCKWEEILEHVIPVERWRNLYQDVKKLTLATKLRTFQYRIINRYLVTNKTVAIWNKLVPDKCTFCGEDVETIVHLFFTCKYVRKLWYAMGKWLENYCNLEFTPSEYMIILNQYKGDAEDLVNTLILITKYYIYVQRCLKREIRFIDLVGVIAKYKSIELDAGRLVHKYKKYQLKWEIYDMI